MYSFIYFFYPMYIFITLGKNLKKNLIKIYMFIVSISLNVLPLDDLILLFISFKRKQEEII